MKKSTVSIIVVLIIIVGAIVWLGKSSSSPSTGNQGSNSSSTPAAPYIPVSETVKSGKTVAYQNAELGFSVKYPSEWEKIETDTGVSFVMPIDKSQVSTVAKLQGDIAVSSGKCAFPPVTTIKDRATVPVGALSFNTISMSNSVQGRDYFNRMYELQHGDVCYVYTFTSITLPTSSKNLTGSNATQATNNNKAIVNTADAAFTDSIKSFAFVTGPQGVDETRAAPAK